VEAIRFSLFNISILARDEEDHILMTAYEKGLFSHFSSPYNKDSLSSELKSLLSKMKELNWERTLTSANFIRDLLRKKNLYEDLLRFDQKLLSYFPAHPDLLLQIASTQGHLGAEEKMQQTLGQVKIIDNAFIEKAEELGATLVQELKEKKEGPFTSTEVTNILGWETCLLVDNDETSINFLQDVLSGFGVNSIEVCNDGVTAWQWLAQNDCPNLIVMEWKIPALTGPLLLQRIRYKFPTANILLISSLVERKDKSLLEEMGVTAVLKKPLDEDLLQKALIYIAQQEKVPTRVGSLEKKF
jgi:FOG: CheY-like receiver